MAPPLWRKGGLHLSLDCKIHWTCDVCKQNHPGILQYWTNRTDNRNHLETMLSSHHILVVILRQVIKPPLFHRASSGEEPQGRSNGSTFTFCTESLMRLNISGERTNVLLCTMNHVDRKYKRLTTESRPKPGNLKGSLANTTNMP